MLALTLHAPGPTRVPATDAGRIDPYRSSGLCQGTASVIGNRLKTAARRQKAITAGSYPRRLHISEFALTVPSGEYTLTTCPIFRGHLS